MSGLGLDRLLLSDMMGGVKGGWELKITSASYPA